MKNRQLNTFLITFGITMVILFVARPKNNLLRKSKLPPKISPPKKVNNAADESHKNGMVIIDAMRTAIKDNTPQDEITKLNTHFKTKYNLKVYFADGDSGKLVAKNLKGTIVAKEK